MKNTTFSLIGFVAIALTSTAAFAGDNDKIYIQQVNATGSEANVYQSGGSDNDASIIQVGPDHLSDIVEKGTGNRANSYLNGEGNTSAIYQTGDNNAANINLGDPTKGVTLDGSTAFSFARISQTGSGHIATAKIIGNTNTSVTNQFGANNIATTHIDGNFTETFIYTDGIGNKAVANVAR